MYLSATAEMYLLLAGKALAILVLGYVAIRIILGIAKRALKKTGLDESLHKFILNSIKAVLWIVLAVTVLGALGIPTSTFIAVLGACGAAIALALKDSLGNVAGGIIVLINRPFKRGDFININGVEGVVETIDLLITTLRTYDNKIISVPNGTISTSVLTNYSAAGSIRVDCTFGIGYQDDIAKAKEILHNVAESNEDIFLEPAPTTGVVGHLDSCVAIELRVWCKLENSLGVKYYLYETVKNAFDEANISIPFPQTDVHLHK